MQVVESIEIGEQRFLVWVMDDPQPLRVLGRTIELNEKWGNADGNVLCTLDQYMELGVGKNFPYQPSQQVLDKRVCDCCRGSGEVSSGLLAGNGTTHNTSCLNCMQEGYTHTEVTLPKLNDWWVGTAHQFVLEKSEFYRVAHDDLGTYLYEAALNNQMGNPYIIAIPIGE